MGDAAHIILHILAPHGLELPNLLIFVLCVSGYMKSGEALGRARWCVSRVLKVFAESRYKSIWALHIISSNLGVLRQALIFYPLFTTAVCHRSVS